MSGWSGRALISLAVAVACAKATNDDLLPSGEDDSGGTSGSGASPFGGASGFGGTTSGGTTNQGGSATGGKGGAAPQGGTGTGGNGGSDSGGATDGGEGGTDSCSPPATAPDLRLDYKADARAATDDPGGQFHVVNATDDLVDLSELTLRYWFRSEFACDQTTDAMTVNVVTFQFHNPFENKTMSDVSTRVVSLGTGAPGCDAYFEVGFDANVGSLEPAQYALVGYFAQIPIYTRSHDQSNDYSYGACTTMPVYFDRVTLYRSGRLVSGREPGGGGEGGAGGEGGGGMGGV